MAIGTIRTILQTITVGANSVKTFKRNASALPAPHHLVSFEADDPGIDLVAFTVNGLHSRRILPTDTVFVILANNTAGNITCNVTITLQELSTALPTT